MTRCEKCISERRHIHQEITYPSGNIGIIVVEKINGKMKELATIGIAKSEEEVTILLKRGKEWIGR